MKITHLNSAGAGINLALGEASLLLQGLEEQREELGELAEDLISLLRSKGVVPPPIPHHIRSEYMGPED